MVESVADLSDVINNMPDTSKYMEGDGERIRSDVEVVTSCEWEDNKEEHHIVGIPKHFIIRQMHTVLIVE